MRNTIDLMLSLALLESSGMTINQTALDALQCAIEHILGRIQ